MYLIGCAIEIASPRLVSTVILPPLDVKEGTATTATFPLTDTPVLAGVAVIDSAALGNDVGNENETPDVADDDTGTVTVPHWIIIPVLASLNHPLEDLAAEFFN